jgi:hypothetical protein
LGLVGVLAALLVMVAPAAASSGGAGTAPSGKSRTPSRPVRHGPLRRAWVPLSGRGMWIWYVSASNRGNLSSIIATAHRYGVSTLMIKSGDGSSAWSQFNPRLVSALHASGLRVCAWQYVYGNFPKVEAQVGAAAVKDGADCLIIDAESQYEGKYIQAQTYIAQLRQLIGARYPVALAGFPYIDYHPSFPYSVFLGPNGAQYNAPQMYWVDIGTSVDGVYAHTFAYNRIYGRPIAPLGQVTSHPPARQIVRFRQLSDNYGSTGVSWWVWQGAAPVAWPAVSRPAGPLANFTATPTLAEIQRGSQGDLVVWAQEHLLSAGLTVTVDGHFGPSTQTAVEAFQQANGLTVDGIIGPETWQVLLRYAPANVVWTKSGATTATAAGARSARAAGRALVLRVPRSARLHANRYEIPPSIGAGRPR